jgi:hypothetical protein
MSFSAWENFYVIVGSSAAALTGLMFVVIALVAEYRATMAQIDAFGTPTVVHFGAVLLVSAIMSAPWPALSGARIALGLCGAAGVVYVLIVLNRGRRQHDYQPVFEDWLFHFILPCSSYAAVLAAAVGLASFPVPLFFVVAGATLVLLFSSIHNSWDTVTYIVLTRRAEFDRRQREKEQP